MNLKIPTGITVLVFCVISTFFIEAPTFEQYFVSALIGAALALLIIGLAELPLSRGSDEQ